MGYSHEIILPNEDLSFKMFLFEGKNGNYVRGCLLYTSDAADDRAIV